MRKWPNFPELEKKILKFWGVNKIFKKSLEQRKSAPAFVFYEGPPFANGRPGVHHVLARAFKDLIARYKTMRGFYVERKAGWDTHGLPTEIEAEKKLGLGSKKEIEKVGIEKFIDECKASVFLYKAEWEKMTRAMAYWVDLKNAYITCSNDYIESIWWILKEIWQKKLLYQDYKVIPYCPRCGTTLSSHEVAQGYKKISEPAIFLKLKISNRGLPPTPRLRRTRKSATPQIINSKGKIYLLVWTTTPWTLPGNVAVAVNPGLTYSLVKVGGEYLILAKKRLSVLGDDYEVVQEFKGKDLLGLEYEPLYRFIKPKKKAWFIISGDFVTVEEGTGLVHIAPTFGQDDMEVAKKNNLEVFMTVDLEGRFTERVIPWAGKFVKDADTEITDDLARRGLLHRKEIYIHDYPFCWRCGAPLLYYAKLSWFIKMSLLKDKLIRNNKKINWIPAYIKEGRFGQWLEEIRDWAISRERYWGTPLPIWRCQIGRNKKQKTKNKKPCDNVKVIGSVKELEELSGKRVKDLHRPHIDKITFKCDKCGGEMKRVPEVLDCWFDSGSMPFAQWHWPFENKKKIDEGENFPADFICEAIDQTRGWFYTLLAISTLLEKGLPYKNVISLGHVLDARGEKMSKSKGNVVSPEKAIGEYGADALRWYFYTINQPGDSKRFDFKGLKEVFARHLLTLWNTYKFFNTYATGQKLKVRAASLVSGQGSLGKDQRPTANDQTGSQDQKPITINGHILDRWIVSELNMLIDNVTLKLDKYDVTGAIRDIEGFIDDLSNWYVRRSRRRFRQDFVSDFRRVSKRSPYKSERLIQDQKKAIHPVRLFSKKSNGVQTLYLTLIKLVQLLAPFVPFITEEIYRDLTQKGMTRHAPTSVHLCDWPKADIKLIDKDLNKKMALVRQIVALGLAARAKARIKVRQPLKKLKVQSAKLKVELVDLVKDELNVKEIGFIKKIKKVKGLVVESDGKITVTLDTRITKELKEEGLAREIVRQIQELRKAAGYKFSDKIVVYFNTKSLSLAKILNKWQTYIEKETISKIEKLTVKIKVDREKEIELKGEKLWLAVNPVRLFRKKSNGVKK